MLPSEHVCNDNRRVDWPKLGETLRKMRERANLKPAHMAQRMGVSKSTIKRIEEATNRPDVETLERYVGECGVMLSELFRLTEGGTVSAVLGARGENPPPSSAADELSRAGNALVLAASHLRKAQSVTGEVRKAGGSKARRTG